MKLMEEENEFQGENEESVEAFDDKDVHSEEEDDVEDNDSDDSFNRLFDYEIEQEVIFSLHDEDDDAFAYDDDHEKVSADTNAVDDGTSFPTSKVEEGFSSKKLKIDDIITSQKFNVEDEITVEEQSRILSSKSPISVADAIQILSSTHPLTAEEVTALKSNFRGCDILYDVIEFLQDNAPDIPRHYPFLDPDNPNTYTSYSFRAYGRGQFDPNHENSISYPDKRLYIGPVFELYSISINKLDPDRDLSFIHMSSSATKNSFIIYKRPSGKEIKLDQPLPLKCPFPSLTPESYVLIKFIYRNAIHKDYWYFDYDSWHFDEDSASRVLKPTYNTIIFEERKDEYNDSIATISYQVIISGLRAELAFIFVEDKGRDIYVTYGAITATDAGDSRTERIIRQYSKEAPVCLPSGELLEVNVCSFGVPTSLSYLRVSVELVYFVDGSPDEEKKIKGFLDFEVPSTHASTKIVHLPASDSSSTFLSIETCWTDPDSWYWY